MSHCDDELDVMKRYPLTEVLARLGYVENRRKSSRHSSFMVHPKNGSKLVVSLNTNGHWRFFPIGSHGRGGTVIDALALILGHSIGASRLHMRPLLSGKALPPPDPRSYSVNIAPVEPDIAEVRRLFLQSVQPLDNGVHDYLNRHRMISPALLMRAQFRGTVFSDHHGNAVFPHRDKGGGIVGAELRKHRFQGQIKGGRKTLWYTNVSGQAEKMNLAIFESGIDAASYAALHFDSSTCYVSTGGTFSPLQRDLIASAIAKLPTDRGGVVIAGTDHDEAGDEIASSIQSIFDSVGRSDLHFRRHRPERYEHDWNDVLAETVRPSSHRKLDL